MRGVVEGTRAERERALCKAGPHGNLRRKKAYRAGDPPNLG